MNTPAEATNIPRDRNLERDLGPVWDSQSHLQSLPKWKPNLAWQVTGWLFVISLLLLVALSIPDNRGPYESYSEVRVEASK